MKGSGMVEFLLLFIFFALCLIAYTLGIIAVALRDGPK